MTATKTINFDIGAGWQTVAAQFSLSEDFPGDNITASELEQTQFRVTFAHSAEGDSFEAGDILTMEVDAGEYSVELIANEIEYLPDDPPGYRKIIPFVQIADNNGVQPGNFRAEFLSDRVGFLESLFAPARSAGNTRTMLLWAAGNTDDLYHVGNFPNDYPTASLANHGAECQPCDELIVAQAFSSDASTIDLAIADYYSYFATHAASLQRPMIYVGCRPSNAEVGFGIYDGIQRSVIDIGADVCFDVLSPIDYDNPKADPRCLDKPWDIGGKVKNYCVAGSVSAGAVSSWTALVGSPWVQGTGANQPTATANVVNGQSAITFDGTNDRMTLASAIVLDETYAIVLTIIKPVNTDSIILSHTASNIQYRFRESLDGMVSAFDGSNAVRTDTGAFVSGTWHNVMWYLSEGDLNIFIDGTDSPVGYVTGNTFATATIDLLGCFGNGGAALFFPSQIAEVAIVKSDESIPQNLIELIAAYAENRYGVANEANAPTLPMRELWDTLCGDSDYPGRLSKEPIELVGSESMDGWFIAASNAGKAGCSMSVSNRNKTSFDPENTATFNRYDLSVHDTGFETPEYLSQFDNGDGTTAEHAAILLNSDTNATLTRDAIQWILDNTDTQRIYVDVAIFNEEEWAEIMAMEASANEPADGGSSRIARVERIGRVNRFATGAPRG